MSCSDRGRRRALAVLGACALVAALPALAQDPRLTQAQAAGKAWLVLADADDASRTYKTAAARFRKTVPEDKWPEAFRVARGQFGKNLRRALVSTQPSNGTPTDPGEFVVMIFRSSFEKRDDAVETLTIEREADGTWRVAGYLMR